MSMLTKYNDQQVNWKAVTYDDYEYFWSDAEYEVYKKATENADLKILHFKDGSLAIADVRRVEPYDRPQTWEERTGVDISKLL
jgi:hypothetical protein